MPQPPCTQLAPSMRRIALELPFIIIQLPQWIDRATAEAHADPLDWPVIRDAQWAASREIPSVATVCTIDCGEFDNIHPYDKRTVGERTAAMALGTMYRCREIAVCGPEPLAIRAVDGSADYSADGCAGGCAGGGDGSDGSSDDSERGGAVLVRYRPCYGTPIRRDRARHDERRRTGCGVSFG